MPRFSSRSGSRQTSDLAPRKSGDFRYKQLQRQLLAWFQATQRPLPWRSDPRPYHVWLSEIMLQQTQVATVLPYFQRFITALPTIADLAAADEATVLRLWEGLGYYRRARALHRSARIMVERHGGEVPRDPDALAALPGIGRYTLGAILSQAFRQRWPIVDGNVARVLCRWFNYDGDPRSAAGQRWLWTQAESILPHDNVGTFNQALMELGAPTCTPRAPACLLCPVATHCAARKQGTQERVPRVAKPPRTTHVTEVAIVLWRRGKVLLVQRPAHASRWANLWEFPHGEVLPNEDERAAARRVLGAMTGLKGRMKDSLAAIRHGITRFQITLHCWQASLSSGRYRSDDYQEHAWVRPAELGHYPMSAPQRRLAKLVQELK